MKHLIFILILGWALSASAQEYVVKLGATTKAGTETAVKATLIRLVPHTLMYRESWTFQQADSMLKVSRTRLQQIRQDVAANSVLVNDSTLSLNKMLDRSDKLQRSLVLYARYKDDVNKYKVLRDSLARYK